MPGAGVASPRGGGAGVASGSWTLGGEYPPSGFELEDLILGAAAALSRDARAQGASAGAAGTTDEPAVLAAGLSEPSVALDRSLEAVAAIATGLFEPSVAANWTF